MPAIRTPWLGTKVVLPQVVPYPCRVPPSSWLLISQGHGLRRSRGEGSELKCMAMTSLIWPLHVSVLWDYSFNSTLILKKLLRKNPEEKTVSYQVARCVGFALPVCAFLEAGVEGPMSPMAQVF